MVTRDLLVRNPEVVRYGRQVFSASGRSYGHVTLYELPLPAEPVPGSAVTMATRTDVLPELVCPDCRGHFRIVSGTWRHGIGSCSCQHLVIADGVVFPARGPRGRRLLEALQKQPGRRPPRVIPLRSWLRVRCMELSRTRVTFRRYLRHRCARLAADKPDRWRVLPSTLGKPTRQALLGRRTVAPLHAAPIHRAVISRRPGSIGFAARTRRADSGRSMRDGSPFALPRQDDRSGADRGHGSGRGVGLRRTTLLHSQCCSSSGLGYERAAAPPRRKRRCHLLSRCLPLCDGQAGARQRIHPSAQKRRRHCHSASPQWLATQSNARYTIVAG